MLFDSYLTYCSLVWAQNCSTTQQIVILQKKSYRISNFQSRNSCTSPLFKQASILKCQYKICLENVLLSLPVFNTWFIFSSYQHNYETSSSKQGSLIKLFIRQIWKVFNNCKCPSVVEQNPKTTKNMLLKDLTLIKIKTAVVNFYLKPY